MKNPVLTVLFLLIIPAGLSSALLRHEDTDCPEGQFCGWTDMESPSQGPIKECFTYRALGEFCGEDLVESRCQSGLICLGDEINAHCCPGDGSIPKELPQCGGSASNVDFGSSSPFSSSTSTSTNEGTSTSTSNASTKAFWNVFVFVVCLLCSFAD